MLLFHTFLPECALAKNRNPLLINIYSRQTANVRWDGHFSKEFRIANGVRQGAVLSPILYCFYMNDLFEILRNSRSGCKIANLFAGVFGYADDLLMISPSRSGLQDMINITEKYARDHKIGFSTNANPEKSKTKGIIFSKHEVKWSPLPLRLGGNSLPWVKSGKYLGSKLTNLMDGYAADTRVKRAQYIDRNNDLLQEFGFAHPNVKSRINMIYNSSFPGSILWDLQSRNVKMLENSWSVSVRYMWNLPNNAHRYFIEPLGGTHARTMLFSRYVSFIQSAKKSAKLTVQQLLQITMNNVNTITGKNIRHILTELNQSDIFKVKKHLIKKEYKFAQTMPVDEWKEKFVKELTDVKQNVLFIPDDNNGQFSSDELSEILDYITTV